MRQLDVLFVCPNASDKIYQGLSKEYSAIEPPIWAMLLAGLCRQNGFGVAILDAEAEQIDYSKTVDRIVEHNPRLVCFVSYGQQPSSSTQNMEGVIETAKLLTEKYPVYPVMTIGGHVAALPLETLSYNCIDFIAQDYGGQCLVELLQTDLIDVDNVKSLGWKDSFSLPQLNTKGFSLEHLDDELPELAFDLIDLPKYRTSLWHSLPNGSNRQPFMSIYTSLNCPYSCSFCCIAAPFGKPGIKHWSPEYTIGILEILAKLGIVNLKIADEMALLNQSGFLDVCKLIIERNLKFNIWCYGRVDQTKPEWLDMLKQAGVNFIALGIETPNQAIRQNVIKGQYKEVRIEDIIQQIQKSDISVAANYIFGLDLDSQETMQETLDFALHNITEMANFYCAQAYPGSKLYQLAKESGIPLPQTYSGYSQHSYDCFPLSTKFCTNKEVLKFRDEAWLKYHTNPEFLALLLNKFGEKAYNNTLNSTKIPLRRKLLET